MGLAPWGSLGGGKFKTEEQWKATDGRKVQATEDDIKVSKVLEKVARRKNTIITSVALAYVMHKAPFVFPIVVSFFSFSPFFCPRFVISTLPAFTEHP